MNHPLDHLFRPYEPFLADIISRYPSASTVACSGRAAGTVRQNISRALRTYIANPGISSSIPRELAAVVDREFVFSPNPDGSIYIGPKRKRISPLPITVSTEGYGPTPPPIPPIDCSNPLTLNAILHLKNYDHIPIPLTLHSFQPSDSLPSLYPNVELISNTDGSFTIL